ncbi:bifunctional glycosyltransferase/CDP-glycerol:glycerophosphate glycerophosphotransferase [Acinetobacter lanii]|uniref:CDP-glycerol:glycerophosphate glycerophosphotransferase n=1 Tax=Acinetobacter lanii TaxID=2715163 RepID=A0A6G8S7U4_9GAMM|nr:CDP-glycerol glycerophosphotransferase family protein [Acinetobacter lanii]QIO10172.1 CDP-glycerol:glycerophosphate glycerophosphotransferase [Acinetobacter lanii]
MTLENVEISIIIPMYNVENLILETLSSIAKNECNFEALIINDGSTDSSLERAESFCKKDSRFKVISQPNQGVSVARNLGIDLAQGKYITFIDSDDIVPDRALDNMLKTAYSENADFVYGKVRKFNSTRQWANPNYEKYNLFSFGEKKLVNNTELLFFLGVAGKLISRRLLGDLRFPKGVKYTEDQVVMFQICLNANKIFTISELVYLYRERDTLLNEASATQSQDKKAFIFFKDSLSTLLTCRNAVYSSDILSDNEKKILIKSYYNRIFTFDAWPLFVKVLKNDINNINSAILFFLDFLKKHSYYELNEIATFRYYLIKIFVDKIYLLSFKNFFSYRQLLSYLFNNLNNDVKNICAKENVYGDKWVDSYKIALNRTDKAIVHFNLVKYKKFIFNQMKNEPQFIREKYFPLLSKLPIEKGKVVFATNRKKPMSSNFSAVSNAIKGGNYKIYKFLGETNSVKTIATRYYHLATADVIFLEDYYKPIYGLNFRKETKVVQLWHACGAFKKFAFSALDSNDSNTKEFETLAHNMYTDVCVSADTLVPLYAKAFNLPQQNVKALGIPRTDLFYNVEKMEKIKEKLLKKYPNLRNSINIVYAPTFRGSTSVRQKFHLDIDWKQFCASFPYNYKLIVKLHPVVKEVYPPIPDFAKDKVILMPSNENIDDLMIFCDCLITDYSSVIFEYSLLNKPLVLFAPDIDKYFDERGFYYAYEEYAYGEIVYNTYDLVNAIKKSRFRYNDFLIKRQAFLDTFMSSCDGNSTKRLLDNVFESCGG